MIYRIDQSDYADFDVIERGKLAPRSYFIPFPTREEALAATPDEKRYVSPLVTCLDGDWDFYFVADPNDLPDELDTDAVAWDTLDVPSCWQFRGYDRPFYLNTRYQFDFKPPRIPTTEPVTKVFSWFAQQNNGSMGFLKVARPKAPEFNFVGVYRRFVDIPEDDASRRHILSFLGVASCADVYWNGERVGYSEGSHNVAEFDVTPLARAGQNELVVVVRRWCTGTYLECQDMFRNNGIFRDVLLYSMAPDSMWDLDVKAEKAGKAYRLDAKVEVADGTPVTFTLQGHGLELTAVATAAHGMAEAAFEGLDVLEWNAEQPNLYDLLVETPSECVRQRVGFKDVSLAGGVFRLNGRLVKLRGVNHHDTSCTNGYTMTPAEIRRDVELCKEFNVNTVRTSHYPPDPLFLELAAELGIYIVDETDLETHGAWAQTFPPDFGRLTNNVSWQSRYLDRVRRIYGRDKNQPAVLMWSLGNESGGYKNTDAMYAWLKERTKLPVHYESVIHSKRKAYDVGSEMYPSVDQVRQIGEKTYKVRELCDRPYFMCEYAHAMGVGPGGIEDYWKVIYAHDSLMGGCVWEMVDHAVLHEDGSYTYGGDHGEWIHDGNFCVDGVFYPDRTPSTGAKLMRFTYRPLRVSLGAPGRVKVFNTLGFTDGTAYELRFVADDGRTATLEPEVGPLETAEFPVAVLEGARRVDVNCVEKATGREVSVEQLELAAPELPAPAVTAGPVAVVGEDGRFSLDLGGGVVLEQSAPYTVLFRAPTDNDRPANPLETPVDLSRATERLCEIRRESGRTTVVSELAAKGYRFRVEDVYETIEGGVLVTSRIHCEKGKGDLPRFGKAFALPASFDDVRYLGRCGESYADMQDWAPVRKTACHVANMTEPNIRPQESGNRMKTEWAEVADEAGRHVRFEAVDKPFELGIKPYTDVALLGMRHREDEVRTGTYVTIQAFQKGIGTGSCGPSTAPEYRYDMRQDYELRFVIRTA